jgi:cytochrome c biogenesis protein CcmG, thiol:disulfide interchange protein DsbE
MNRRNFSAALVASAGFGGCQGDSAYAVMGKKLPAIQGVYVDGTDFDLAKLAKPAIVRFWGLWCGPCVDDMANWLSVVRQVRADKDALADLNILTIHSGTAPESGPTLAQWASDQAPDVATPVVNDATTAIKQAVGVPGLPSTVYINPEGRILEHSWQFRNDRGVTSFLRKVKQLHSLPQP